MEAWQQASFFFQLMKSIIFIHHIPWDKISNIL
jgi:hypothetical protein